MGVKWPFVSRLAFDTLLSVRAAEREWHREAMARSNATLNSVLALNEELRREAAIARAEPTRLLEPWQDTSSEPTKKSPIAERIDQISEGDARMKRHFWQFVSKLRKEGKSDGDIIDEIRWDTTEVPE